MPPHTLFGKEKKKKCSNTGTMLYKRAFNCILSPNSSSVLQIAQNLFTKSKNFQLMRGAHLPQTPSSRHYAACFDRHFAPNFAPSHLLKSFRSPCFILTDLGIQLPGIGTLPLPLPPSPPVSALPSTPIGLIDT